MSASHLSRLAGPAGIATGALLVIGELVILQFDVSDHVATSTNTVFQLGQAVYYLGFVGLMVFLFASSREQEDKGGKFGVFATLAALVGTMALGGDLWFETWAIPWIADESPAAFDADPTAMLIIGAISSYLLFAIGWVLYGIASFRKGVYPKVISASIVIGGVLGFQALLSPWGVPLGLAVGAAGVWLVRQRSAVDSEATTTPAPHYVG